MELRLAPCETRPSGACSAALLSRLPLIPVISGDQTVISSTPAHPA
jgi:hypothetical protein